MRLLLRTCWCMTVHLDLHSSLPRSLVDALGVAGCFLLLESSCCMAGHASLVPGGVGSQEAPPSVFHWWHPLCFTPSVFHLWHMAMT